MHYSSSAEPSQLQVCILPALCSWKVKHTWIIFKAATFCICNGLGACRPSVNVYQLMTDISLKPQECNHLQLSVHIHSNRQPLWTKTSVLHFCQASGLLHLFNISCFLPCTNGEGKDSQFAERHKATKMCKFSKSLGKIPSSIPPMLRTGCHPDLLSHADMDADQVTFRQAFGCPVRVLSDIQHNKCSKMPRVHL